MGTRVKPTKEGLHSTIRALLEMTESRGCTKAEAALARGKALNLMRKYGVSVEDLTQPSPFAAAPQAAAAAPPVSPAWQKTDPGRRAAYDYWSTHGFYSDDAFVREVFSRRSARGRKPLPRVARIIAGFGIAGLAVLIMGDIGQMFTPEVRATAPPTAKQTRSADYVSSLSSAQPQAPAASYTPSPQAIIRGVYQQCLGGRWFKFEVGRGGKAVGTADSANTPWPDVPVWK
jgi:hypothetical protein